MSLAFRVRVDDVATRATRQRRTRRRTRAYDDDDEDDACDDDAYDDDDAVWERSMREECVDDNADAGRFLSWCSSEKRRRRQRCGGVTELRRWW